MRDVQHHRIRTNGVRLHVATAGPEEGPLVVLLHGFPETWYGWRHQIPALAAAGFRVVAPDLRGFGASDRPRAVSAYRLDEFGADVLGLVDAMGREHAAVAGHDWGAAVAWWLAATAPERVPRVAILNVPHPAAMRRTLMRNPRQWARSLYVLFFNLPLVAEAVLTSNGGSVLRDAMLRTSRPGTFPEEHLERYREAWTRPGAMRGMLGPYRAAVRHGARFPHGRRVRVPVHVLWGVHDHALEIATARASMDLCDDGRLTLFEDATHWLQHEEPDRVNRLLIEHFSS